MAAIRYLLILEDSRKKLYWGNDWLKELMETEARSYGIVQLYSSHFSQAGLPSVSLDLRNCGGHEGKIERELARILSLSSLV